MGTAIKDYSRNLVHMFLINFINIIIRKNLTQKQKIDEKEFNKYQESFFRKPSK